ncbi:MAG: hypothetical protein ACERKN_07105 [Velocimicrobium sp.]
MKKVKETVGEEITVEETNMQKDVKGTSSTVSTDTLTESVVISGRKEILVYCGPTIRNSVSRNEMFTNGIPETLKKLSESHKAVKRLIVPVEKMVQITRNIATKGTVEYVSYQKVLEIGGK